jgi:hypothetical protein
VQLGLGVPAPARAIRRVGWRVGARLADPGVDRDGRAGVDRGRRGGELRDGRPLIRSRQQEQDVVGGPREVEQARILAVGVPQADDVGGAVPRLDLVLAGGRRMLLDDRAAAVVGRQLGAL